MKRQVRSGCFETNSSSVHSLTICTEAEYNAWLSGKKVYDYYGGKLVDAPELSYEEKAEARQEYEAMAKSHKYYVPWDKLDKDAQNQWYQEYKTHELIETGDDQYMSYDTWANYHDYCEYYTQHYTTPKGEKLVAFGYYGHD